MTTNDSLGQFEQLVLTAIVMLGEEAYTVPIQHTVAELSGKLVKRGPVSVTLMRLQDKRYVSSRLADPTPERGGRAKRYFRLEPPGERALKESAETAKRVYDVIRAWAPGNGRPGRWKPTPAS